MTSQVTADEETVGEESEALVPGAESKSKRHSTGPAKLRYEPLNVTVSGSPAGMGSGEVEAMAGHEASVVSSVPVQAPAFMHWEEAPLSHQAHLDWRPGAMHVEHGEAEQS